jgi:hypothetical protein
MSKIGLHCSFGHLKHKLWPKEGLGVKLAVWLPTTKSRESTWFTCLQTSCNIPLESSRRELQLCFGLHFDWRFDCKVMGLQSRGRPNLGDFGTPTWESQDKKPFGCGLRCQPQSILYISTNMVCVCVCVWWMSLMNVFLSFCLSGRKDPKKGRMGPAGGGRGVGGGQGRGGGGQ